MELGKFRLLPKNVTTFFLEGRKAVSCMLVLDTSRKQWKTTSARGARAQGAGGVHSASWGNPRGGGRAGGGLKPEAKVTLGGDMPLRLGDVVTFEDMPEIIVAYSKYEQQMQITNQDGGDRVLARRRELVDSATQMMVAYELYDGKPWVDLSEEELMQGLTKSAGGNMQQTSDEDFCRQLFRMLKMDADVTVDSTVFMQKCALRKCLADSGLTEVVRPNGRLYTLKHGKVLVEAIAAGIGPLEFRRKAEKNMCFDVATHEPDAVFSIIAKQQRDQAIIEATMLYAGKQQRGVPLGRWLLRGPSRREILLTGTTQARVPRLPV